MKVLHVINSLSGGGAELHLLTLCRHHKALGVEPVVAFLREHVTGSVTLRPMFEQEGIRIIDLHAGSRCNVGFPETVRKLCHLERPDVLHTHLPRPDLAGSFARAMDSEIRWVSSVHDPYNENWSAKKIVPLYRWVWSRADRLVAISDRIREWLVDVMRIPHEKVTLVEYGIDIEPYNSAASSLRREWNLENHRIIGSVGRLEYRKGHQCLIRAMPFVLERVPNACLIIAGHDPEGFGRVLRKEIEALGLKDRVRLVGFREDIPALLHSLDVFAFASFSEGFGQAVIEAMAAGKAIVASNIRPLSTIIVDEETGILADRDNSRSFAEAIVRLLSDSTVAEAMGRRAKERVAKRFSAGRMAEEILGVYELVSGPVRVAAKAAS